MKYGFLNFLATTLFLLALGLLYGLLGTLNMADIIGAAATRQPGAAHGRSRRCSLLAFGMKAAAFPVNAWLPASYHTPPPAISALMAGLLTKVGVYALLRTLVMLLPAAARCSSRRCSSSRSRTADPRAAVGASPKPTCAAPSAFW